MIIVKYTAENLAQFIYMWAEKVNKFAVYFTAIIVKCLISLTFFTANLLKRFLTHIFILLQFI